MSGALMELTPLSCVLLQLRGVVISRSQLYVFS